ncbi:MAG: hypothetical protein WCB96_13045 [Candidatus Aminicenantales bacterium]
MKSKSRAGFLSAAVCLSVFLSAIAQLSDEGWVKSKDPCYLTKQQKKYAKQNFGSDMPYMTCIPLGITLDWKIDVQYQRHPPFGNDQMSLFIREEYPAFLELLYDQKKRDVLQSFKIMGPAPCCPGQVTADLVSARAAFWACDGHTIRDCVRVTTSTPVDFELTSEDSADLAFSWSRDGLDCEGGADSSRIEYRDKPPRAMLSGLLYEDPFQIKVKGTDSLTWEEVRQGMEDESLYKAFSFQSRTVFPSPKGNLDHTYSMKGKADLYISFGETKEEVWTVTIEGREKDEPDSPITYKDRDKTTKELPISVQFDWLAQARLTLRKAKKARFYDSGTITKFSQSPQIIFGHPELYRCFLSQCPGDRTYQNMSLYESAALPGEVQGESLSLGWPAYPSQACVVCSPLKMYLGKIWYRHEFGGGDVFMKRMAEMWLPLKDGLVKTGTTLEGVEYKITLKKIK